MPTNAIRPARAPSKTATPSPPADPGLDRLIDDPTAAARATWASRSRGRSDRRRLVAPTTCERDYDYTPAELELMRAMQEYKRVSGRMFPTWSEVLGVVQALGYRNAAELDLRGATARGAT
jgi:hypothetical protein